MKEVYYDPRKVVKYGELVSEGGAIQFPKQLPSINKKTSVLVGIIITAYAGVSTFGIELKDEKVYDSFKKQLSHLWLIRGGAWLLYKVNLQDTKKCLHFFKNGNALISSTNPKKDGLELLLNIADYRVNL